MMLRMMQKHLQVRFFKGNLNASLACGYPYVCLYTSSLWHHCQLEGIFGHLGGGPLGDGGVDMETAIVTVGGIVPCLESRTAQIEKVNWSTACVHPTLPLGCGCRVTSCFDLRLPCLFPPRWARYLELWAKMTPFSRKLRLSDVSTAIAKETKTTGSAILWVQSWCRSLKEEQRETNQEPPLHQLQNHSAGGYKWKEIFLPSSLNAMGSVFGVCLELVSWTLKSSSFLGPGVIAQVPPCHLIEEPFLTHMNQSREKGGGLI